MKKTIKLNLLARVATLLLLTVFTTASAWADAPDHKIVVIADPHVMHPELLTNAGTAWTNYLAGSRKLIDYSKALFDQVVFDIKDKEKPELVLIVGDLSKDGEVLSHNYVIGKLEELKNAGIPTLVIPGNHDWGTNSDAVYYNGESTTPAITITKEGFATLYANYGYGSTSERESTTLTYACEPIPGLVVIGIDSGRNGTLSDETLDWVCSKATAARTAGKKVIAMMHHPLIPHITGGDTFVSSASIANYETVRNSLADAGISTIFTGHFHTSDIARDWNADKSKTIFDISTGALCSYPCDYRVVTLNNTMTTMSIATRSITSAGQSLTGEAFSTGTAKTCLTSSMEKIITDKKPAASPVASSLANAYIYHAEGNENLSTDAATCLSELNSTLSLAKAFKIISDEQYNSYSDLINSMLLDKSNYGDTNREDQTNDHALTILTIGNGGWATWYDTKSYTLSEGAQAYYVSSVGSGEVQLTAIEGGVPANLPVLISGSGEVTLTEATEAITLSGTRDEQFKGTPTALSATDFTDYFAAGRTYVLYGGKFLLVEENSGIGAHKCWLTLSGSNARQLNLNVGDATGITPTPNPSRAGGEWYTLDGRKLSGEPTRKGLYIYKGKKVKK